MTDSSVALRRARLAALIPDPSRRILRLPFPVALHQSACRLGSSRIPATRLRNAEMADALVMDADRIPYTRVIVNRLAFKDKVIKASEHFEDG